MNIQKSFVCPTGFRVSEIHSGIKSSRSDILALVSDCPAYADVVYTQNHVKGAHIFSCQEKLRRSGQMMQSLLINSGIANALTGQVGIDDVNYLTKNWAKLCSIEEDHSLMFSTGVVGERLPVLLMDRSLPSLYRMLSDQPKDDFGWGMMTTDTRLKSRTVQVETSRGWIRFSGMSKGAGMIHPRLATMLCFVVTDAGIPAFLLRKLLHQSIQDSFHCISVDSDTSPNDSVLIMANGVSGIQFDDDADEDFLLLQSVCCQLFLELAVEVVRDAEGLSHLIQIDVQASTEQQARDIAESIATSPLVKTAIFGQDPNWGRIICAAGKVKDDFDVMETSLSICGVSVFSKGKIISYDQELLSQKMSEDVVTVDLQVVTQGSSIRYWTSDLSCEYVRINSDYRT